MTKTYKRSFRAPENHSFFIFGPRGAGKSTWIKAMYPQATVIDLLLAHERRKYSANPELLLKMAEALPNKSIIVLDEIQHVSELLSCVHSIIEQKRDMQFILTGSSARKLKRTGVDLLAGRALKRYMHPFMAVELGADFQLEKALKIGMLPLVWEAKDPKAVLETYIDLYLTEEVLQEGLVRNIGDFARFLKVISFSHGMVINVENIARECGVKRRTVDSYIQILEDLLIGHRISVFTKRAQRVLSDHPKFYLFDTGVYRTLRYTGPMDIADELDGPALEGLVYQHLRAWADYSTGKHEISFWRTKSGLEVDFIVYGEKGFWAIEVKNGSRVFRRDVKGLLHFRQDYPECTPLLVYGGNEILKEAGVLCVPCNVFLSKLQPDVLIA